MMKLPRRQILRLAAGAAASPAVSRMAFALDYPTRPVRIVVVYTAGGTLDIIARLAGQMLSERLGQPFVIENRPGAAGTIGTEMVAKSPADGYTLLVAGAFNAIGAALYKLNFNFIRDIAPIAGISRVPYVMEVNPSVPATTVAEFIAYAKANPGKMNMASAGSGSPQHVVGELFKMMAGVDMLHVPYRGAPEALVGLLGGEMQVMFDVLPASIENIRTGRLRALAVTGATRSEALPDIPTLSDSVPGYEASGWQGMAAPRNTPAEIIEKLNREINAGLADPKIKARLADLGGKAFVTSPAEFGKFIADETEKWARVVKFSGIKAD
jgi:tripartite-type tricarboxylate transporter receptor subunit TctC